VLALSLKEAEANKKISKTEVSVLGNIYVALAASGVASGSGLPPSCSQP